MNKDLLIKLLKHPLFSGSFIMIAGSMVVNIINYVYHLLMGRILGPVEYGTLASIYSILYIVTIVPSSASISIVKFIAAAKDKRERSEIYSSINKFIFRLALALGALVIIASSFISKFLNIGNSTIVILVGPILFFSIISLVNMSTLQGVLKFFGVVGPSLTSAAAKLIFGLVFVFWGYSTFGAIWGVVIGSILAYLVSVFLIKGTVNNIHEEGDYTLGRFFRYSFPVLVQLFAFTSFFTTDLILVKHFLSAYDAGIYAALSTLGKIIFFATSPIAATMFPIVTRRHSRGESYSKILVASIGGVSAISFGVSAIYLLFPKLAISALYGAKYLSASPNLFWMGILIAFYSLSYLITNYYLSIGNIKMVYYPLAAAALQIVGIVIWHDSIATVIKISLFLMIFLTLVLGANLGYNLRLAKNETKKDSTFRGRSSL